MQASTSTADQDQDANGVRDPNVLTDHVETSVPEEADKDCSSHDDADGSFDRKGALSDSGQTLGAPNGGQDTEDADFNDDNQTEEDIWIFSGHETHESVNPRRRRCISLSGWGWWDVPKDITKLDRLSHAE